MLNGKKKNPSKDTFLPTTINVIKSRNGEQKGQILNYFHLFFFS